MTCSLIQSFNYWKMSEKWFELNFWKVWTTGKKLWNCWQVIDFITKFKFFFLTILLFQENWSFKRNLFEAIGNTDASAMALVSEVVTRSSGKSVDWRILALEEIDGSLGSGFSMIVLWSCWATKGESMTVAVRVVDARAVSLERLCNGGWDTGVHFVDSVIVNALSCTHVDARVWVAARSTENWSETKKNLEKVRVWWEVSYLSPIVEVVSVLILWRQTHNWWLLEWCWRLLYKNDPPNTEKFLVAARLIQFRIFKQASKLAQWLLLWTKSNKAESTLIARLVRSRIWNHGNIANISIHLFSKAKLILLVSMLQSEFEHNKFLIYLSIAGK